MTKRIYMTRKALRTIGNALEFQRTINWLNAISASQRCLRHGSASRPWFRKFYGEARKG